MGERVEELPAACGFTGTILNAPFILDIKSQALEQEIKGSNLPSCLEEKCKHQQPRLPAGLLKGMGTCRVRQQHHDLLGQGRPRTLREEGREQECVSHACLRISSYFPPKPSVRLSTCA